MWEIDFNFYNQYFILFSVFVLIFLVQSFYYLFVFTRIIFYKQKATDILNPVSVIICAKNEYINLKKYLPLILEQDYPHFEVVVVDDCSDDDTAYLLKDFKKIYPNLSIVNFTKNVNFFGGKKFPLALGIKSAKNDILIFTDADCYPKSKNWLRLIQQQYNQADKKIVLSYSPYERSSGLLNTLIRFDTFFIAVQYLSYALIGKTYMGVGRNMSYHKSLFVKNKGFTSHYHIASGDDDIFISQVATSKNVAIETSAEAQMVSIPKLSFIEWVKQKRRHFTTFSYYKKGPKILLGLFGFSNIFFFSIFGLLLYLKYNILLVLALYFLRLLIQFVVLNKCMDKLSERKLLLFLPIFDVFIVIFNPIITLSNIVSKKKKWS